MALKEILFDPGYDRLQKVGAIITDLGGVSSAKGVTERGVSVGFHEIVTWNIHNIVRRPKWFKVQKGKIILTADGKDYLLIAHMNWDNAANTSNRGAALLDHISKAKLASETAQFLQEAVACFDHSLFRSAIVLSWVGAMSVLHEHVAKGHLAAFNAEATRRDNKWRTAKTTDDLSRMKEHDFLDIIESLSIIGKNVKQELQKALILRNACGHPNSLAVGEHQVAAHVELLLLNVFTKF